MPDDFDSIEQKFGAKPAGASFDEIEARMAAGRERAKQSVADADAALYKQQTAERVMRDLGTLAERGVTSVRFDGRRARERSAAEVRADDEAQARADKAAFLSDFLGEWARHGGTRKQFEATYDVNNPDDLRAMAESLTAVRRNRDRSERDADPGLVARLAGEPMRVASFGLADPARAGEIMRGGTGAGTDAARARAGLAERFATGVAGAPGYLLPVGKATSTLQALGLGRASLPLAMGGMSAATAAVQGGDPVKAGIQGAIQGTVVQALPVADGLMRRPSGAFQNVAADTVARAATGERQTLEDVGMAAGVGFAMPGGGVQRRPSVTEAGPLIAEAVRSGEVALNEVMSREVAAEVKRGVPLEEAVKVERPVREDGSNGGGYVPDALAKGLVETGAVDVVKQVEAEVGPVISSGQESPVTGKPWALAVNEEGRPVRVEGAETPSAKPSFRELRARLEAGATPTGPVAPRRRGGPESGFAVLPDVASGAKAVNEAVVKPVVNAVRGEAGSMLAEMRRSGPAGAKIAASAEKFIDAEAAYQGKARPAYERAARLLQGTVTGRGEMDAAVRGLQEPYRDPKTGVLLDRLTEIIEGRLAPRNRGERIAAMALRRYAAEAWKLKHEAGVERMDAYNEVGDPLKAPRWRRIPKNPPASAAPGSGVQPRVYAEGFYRAFSGQDPVLERAVVEDVRKANGWSADRAKAWAEGVKGEVAQRGLGGLEVKSAAEFKRDVERMPGAVEVNGRVVPILESNAFHWLQRFHKNSGALIGRRAGFGQGSTDTIPDLAKEAGQDALPKVEDFMRALQHASVEKPLGARGSEATLGPTIQAVLGVLRGLRLTGAVPANVMEIVTGAHTDFGSRVRQLGRRFRDVVSGSEAEQRSGLVTREFSDFTTDPRQPIASRLRKVAAIIRSAVSQPVEFKTEESATKTGEAFAQEASGSKAASDVADLRALGFSDAEAAAWVKDTLPAADRPAFAKRIASRLTQYSTTANMNPAQQGRFQHRRVARFGMAFLNWPMQTFRNTAKRAQVAAKMMGEAFAGKTEDGRVLGKAEAWSHGAAGVGRLGNYLFGRTASYAAANLLATLVLRGADEAENVVRRAINRPLAFLGESLFGGVVTGPAGAISSAIASGDERVLERQIFPWVVAKEAWQAIGATGRYAETPLWERMGALAQTMAPGSRAFTDGVLAQTLYGDEGQAEMKAGMRGYQQFLRDEGLANEGWSEPTEFSQKMRRAVVLMERGKPPEEWAAVVRDALEIPGKEKDASAASQSILARRVMQGKAWTPEMKAKLRAMIGDSQMKALEVRNLALEKYAAALTGKAPKAEAAPKAEKPLRRVNPEDVKKALEGPR